MGALLPTEHPVWTDYSTDDAGKYIAIMEKEYETKVDELRHHFWGIATITYDEYKLELKRLDEWYRVNCARIVSFGDSWAVKEGDLAYQKTSQMTRPEYDRMIAKHLSEAVAREEEHQRIKQSLYSLRDSIGPFGDVSRPESVSNLVDLVTEKPKRRITWWDRVRDVLLWLFDWLAPSDEKHKRECGGYPCDCALVDEVDDA